MTSKVVILTSIAILIIILICVTGFISNQINSKYETVVESVNLLDLSSNLYNGERIDCNREINYCFVDSECARSCNFDSSYRCLHGICRNEVIRVEDPLNDCKPDMGILAYLTGDTQLGRFQFVCKSEDPGIAISSTDNLMCNQGFIEINYLRQFPTISACNCLNSSNPNTTNQVLVPATSVKRRHVQCDSRYWDLVTYDNILV